MKPKPLAATLPIINTINTPYMLSMPSLDTSPVDFFYIRSSINAEEGGLGSCRGLIVMVVMVQTGYMACRIRWTSSGNKTILKLQIKNL